MSTWIATRNRLPQEGIVVETKIADEHGTRNEQTLKRMGNLWFVPDGAMYVYYTPTHWREVPHALAPKPDLTGYVTKMRGLRYTDEQIVEYADMAALLAAAGVTLEQAHIFAKVAAVGSFRRPDFEDFRKVGVNMPYVLIG